MSSTTIKVVTDDEIRMSDITVDQSQNVNSIFTYTILLCAGVADFQNIPQCHKADISFVI